MHRKMTTTQQTKWIQRTLNSIGESNQAIEKKNLKNKKKEKEGQVGNAEI